MSSLVLLLACLASGDHIRIATFDVDATPRLGTPVAYALTRSIQDPLKARGVVILGAGSPIVLCAVDWIGISNDGHDLWCRSLAEAAGTTADRVAVHTIHQHDGPRCDPTAAEMLEKAGLAGKHIDNEFAKATTAGVCNAIRKGIASAVEVDEVSWGQAKAERVASNRRVLGPDGKVKVVRWSKSKDPVAIAAPEGTIDPYVREVGFWSGGKPVAVLSYYAVHPMSYYGQGDVSADFVGLARAKRDSEVPGVLHVHFNGAGGNVTAGKYNDGSRERRPELRDRLADAMKRAWEGSIRRPLHAADVKWATTSVVLPTPSGMLEKYAANFPKLTGNPKCDAAVALVWLQTAAQRPIAVSRLDLGDNTIFHMPGELFIEYALAAEGQLPNRNVCMASYGQYGPGYICTDIAYSQGGYESSDRASHVAPGVEKVLHDALRKLTLDASPTLRVVVQKAASGGFRNPQLVCSAQGTLVALWQDGDALANATSVDGGKNWTIRKPLAMGVAANEPKLTADRKAGTITASFGTTTLVSRDDAETWHTSKGVAATLVESPVKLPLGRKCRLDISPAGDLEFVSER